MTKEEKELLIKDLSTRLPYGVVGEFESGKVILTVNSEVGFLVSHGFKPYLRPMSSMTEEEKHEVMILWNEDFASKESLYHCYPRTTDFYNRHHLDYRGLIEKGLAIEVTKENNPYEN